MKAEDMTTKLNSDQCQHGMLDSRGRASAAIECDQCITAAIDAAVEIRDLQWARAVMDNIEANPKDWVTGKLIDPDFAQGYLRAQREEIAQDAITAERERLIPLVCDLCDEPGVGIPVRLDDLEDLDDLEEPDWWHNADERLCLASPIYEAIRADALKEVNDE